MSSCSTFNHPKETTVNQYLYRSHNAHSRVKFITSNKHKFEEVKYVFNKYDLEVIHQDLTYIELQADSTENIAMASATNLATIVDGDFLMEDSGIRVNALSNFPGPYSSYVYKTLGWQGVLKLMEGVETREASFQSVFVIYKDGEFTSFNGVCSGRIAPAGRGENGFGFDPIFIPDEENEDQFTFAEMGEDLKNRISHRAKSLEKLVEFLI